MRQRGDIKLTARQAETLAHVLDGCVSYRQLGVAMTISYRTAHTHLNKIYDKFGVESMPELILYAVHCGYKVTAYDEEKQ